MINIILIHKELVLYVSLSDLFRMLFENILWHEPIRSNFFTHVSDFACSKLCLLYSILVMTQRLSVCFPNSEYLKMHCFTANKQKQHEIKSKKNLSCKMHF